MKLARLKPHRSTRVLLIYLPIFAALTLFALRIGGIGYRDLIAYALELAPRSMYPIAAIGLAAGLMKLTGFDLSDNQRADLLLVLRECEQHPRWPLSQRQLGALLILAGETLAWMFFVTLFLVALLRWQG